MSQPRWMESPSDIERWDTTGARVEQFRLTAIAKEEYRDLSLALLELFEDDPAAIRADLPERLRERFDRVVQRMVGRRSNRIPSLTGVTS